MIPEESVSRLRRLMEVRQKRDELKAAYETAEKEYREFEADIYEELEENPVSGTLKVDLGEPWGIVSFRPRETYFARVIDPEKALEHFEQRAMIDEMTEPKIVMRRANDLVREAIEQAENPPPGLDFYARRGVTITRQKD